MKRPLSKLSCVLALLLLGGTRDRVRASTLIYYNGSGSGVTVTNLGTLGAAGNGTITTAGTGTVTFQANGGPKGASDAFLSLASTDSNGGWVTVPAASLPNFANSSWSVSGFFNRTSNTNADMLFHMGTGDGFGGDNELYVQGNTGSNSVQLQHYPSGGDVTVGGAQTLGVWHSYAVTFSASGLNNGMGTLTFYQDGVAQTPDSTFDLSVAPFLSQILQWGGIGFAANSGTSSRGLTGGQDDFAFYDTVLSSADVLGLSNGTLTPLTVSVPEPSRVLLLWAAGMGMLMRRRRVRGLQMKV